MDCVCNAKNRKPISNEKYKIIGVSNFSLDSVDEILICDNLSKYYGEKIVKFLEDDAHDTDTYFPRLVRQDHKLYKFKV